MEVSKKIFRNYDIRGIYPDEINSDVAEVIGKGLGTFLKRKGLHTCVVGRDSRESSPIISNFFIKGLVSTGMEVTNVGISLTPVIHFLTCAKHFESGVCITASHNPKEYNGFRIDYKNALPFYGEDLEELYHIIHKGDFHLETGRIIEDDLFYLYSDYFKTRFKFNSKPRVVLDCGNGTTSYNVPDLLNGLGCDVFPMYCSPDSDFPHGVPDPENKLFMKSLEKVVLEQKADIGIAFDEDADRFGVVDSNGVSYENDKLLLFFATQLLKNEKMKGETILYDIKSSGILQKEISKMGGVPRMIRTGHPYFMKYIKDGAVLGAEYSGHTFFADEYYGYDDGIYAACRVLEIIENEGKPLSDIMEKFPKTSHTTEIKIHCPDEIKKSVIHSIVLKMQNRRDVRSVISIDGVRAQFTDTGWVLIRASNTTPKLTVRAEGSSPVEVRFLLDILYDILVSIDHLDVGVLRDAEIYVS